MACDTWSSSELSASLAERHGLGSSQCPQSYDGRCTVCSSAGAVTVVPPQP